MVRWEPSLPPAATLRPEFIQTPGVGLHVADQVFRSEDTEGAGVGAAFGETVLTIPTGNFAADHHGLRVPTVSLYRHGRAVVAGDGQHIHFGQEHAERSVGFFDGLHLLIEIAVLAIHVSPFYVNENEIVSFEGIDSRVELLLHGRYAFDFLHADELGEAFIHRVDGNRRGLESVTVFEKWDLWLVRDAAKQEAISRLAVLQQRQGLFEECRDDLRHFRGLRGFVLRLDDGNGQTFAMWVAVIEWAFESLAAEHHDEAVAFACFDDYLDVADFLDLAGEQRALRLANLGVDAPRAAVGHDAFRVERAEIRAGGYIAMFEINAQPEGFNDTTANFKFQRIVAKQPEMSRAAAGGNARGDRRHAAKRRTFRKGVKVWGTGDFQGCAKAG